MRRRSGASPEEAQILDWLEEKPTLSRHVLAARRFADLHSERDELFTARRVHLVRNYTLEPMEPFLLVAGYRAGVRLDLSYSGYDPTPASVAADVTKTPPDDAVIAIRLEDLSSALTHDFLEHTPSDHDELARGVVSHVVSLAEAVRAASGARVFVHNFLTPVSPAAGLRDCQNPQGQVNTVRSMNLLLVERLASLSGVYLVDVDDVLSHVGRSVCYDRRGARVGGAPLAQPALRAIADAQVRHLLAAEGSAVKCVVVDCDNTLWGGVVGEDGLAGLALGETGAGRRYADFQRDLLNLRRRGVLLAICSKNEERDVFDVLRSHPDCVLKEDDFAAHRVNWQDKVANIEALAVELNLGLGHMAFFDDSRAECEWVASQLPEVRVFLVPDDIEATNSLDDLLLFDSLSVTDEDLRRTEMYRAEGHRRAARTEAPSYDDYLRSLEMTARLGKAGTRDLVRLAQLMQRTNQFNLTTRRYDVRDLERLSMDRDAAVVWVELSDRFGTSGVVGCGIVRVGARSAEIDALLMSCRVLGRGLESLLVNRLAAEAAGLGAEILVGRYIPSRRNGQVADLYARLGFEGPSEDETGRTWEWKLGSGLPAVPDWFKVVDADLESA